MSSDPTDLPAMPEIPSPVTFERLVGLVDGGSWTVDADEKTFLRRWQRAQVVISLPPGDGVVLMFTGTRLGDDIPLSRLGEVQAFVNDWHRERIWPTVVLGTTPTAVVVQTHVGVDATAGLTDSQLHEYLRIGIGTTHQCVQALADAPDVEGSADPETG